MDDIILGRLSASVIQFIGRVLSEPCDSTYKMVKHEKQEQSVALRSEALVAQTLENAGQTMESSALPTAIDELMVTLTSDVVGYVTYRLNASMDTEPPRIVDVDVIQKLSRDIISRTCKDVADADKRRQYQDKCIEAYICVGEIEAWLKRNVSAKNKDVLLSIANLKEILQHA